MLSPLSTTGFTSRQAPRDCSCNATTVQASVDAFPSSPRYASPNTGRGYAVILDRILVGITGNEIAAVLEQLWAAGAGHPGTATAPR